MVTPQSTEALETDIAMEAAPTGRIADVRNEQPGAAPVAVTPVAATARPKAKSFVPAMGRTVHDPRITWSTTIFLVLFHIGAIAAFFFFSWSALAVFAITYFFGTNVGIGMCYHRLLTHRGYKVPKWLEYAMAVCGTLSMEGGPIFWVGTHRVHHQHSDHLGDPHTPREGTWWSHAGWILTGKAMHAETSFLARYAPDLAKDKFYVLLSKYHWVPLLTLGLILLAIGGWPWVLWGIFLRVTVGLHATWLVNSATHKWGSRRFETRDDSRNSWWVALLTGGEGWHNNHHAHPVSSRHGFTWYELDVNFWGIWVLEKIGLAKQVKVAQYDPKNPRPAGAHLA